MSKRNNLTVDSFKKLYPNSKLGYYFHFSRISIAVDLHVIDVN